MSNEFLTFSFAHEGINKKKVSWPRRLQEAVAAFRKTTGGNPATVVIHPKLRQAIEQAEEAVGVSLSISTCPGIPTWELWLESDARAPKGGNA